MDDRARTSRGAGLWTTAAPGHAVVSNLGDMHLDVDTDAVAGVADAVRQAAADLAGLHLPAPPPCEDLAAADAVGALLAVSQEHLDGLVDRLRSAAVLLETARRDYGRAESRAMTRR